MNTNVELPAYEALRNLNADYCMYADTFNVDALVNLFTEDGVFDARAMGLALMQGHAAIREFLTNALSIQVASQHLLGNLRLVVTGNNATGRACFLAQGPTRSGELFAAGMYTDEYVCTPDGWRIARRVSTPLLPTRLGGMPGQTPEPVAGQ